MAQTTEAPTFIAVSPADYGRLAHVLSPTGDPVSCRLPRQGGGERLARAVGEVVKACGPGPVVCFDAEGLSDLLSHPAVLPLTRKVLGRLWDLREAALIFLPGEPHHTLQALALGDPAEDLPPDLARTVAVFERVQGVARSLSPETLAALGPLLAQEERFSWVPWPVGAAEATNLLQVGKHLPQQPQTRKRRPTRNLPAELSEVVAGLLSPEGAVEGIMRAYEHRPGQVDMARAVAQALEEERFLLVEAGTGVGKSLAYLIPAILHSLHTAEPVVVSTNTKNLQEQLLDKDIPLLQQALPFEFRAALVKGRANYPCIRALVTALAEAAGGLFRNERMAAAYLLSWLLQSGNGDLDGVRPQAQEAFPELAGLVSRVRSQGETCRGRSCSHYDHCPVEVARAAARNAEVVVSNHALTFADTRGAILPRYSALVLDEAHNVEQVATDQLSLECSSFGCAQLLRALEGEPSSFREQMQRRLEALADPAPLAAVQPELALLPDLAGAFQASLDEFGDALHDTVFGMDGGAGYQADRASVRLTEEARETPQWQEVASLGEVALEQGMALCARVERVGSALEEMSKQAGSGAAELEGDAEGMRARVAETLDNLRAVLHARTGEEAGEYVTWAEAWEGRRGSGWSLHAAPVDIGPVLDEAIYRHKETVVFTSATLTVDGQFSYLRQRLGLDPHAERLLEVTVPSPFDLMQQLLLCVPADMPDAAEPGFNEAVAEALLEICRVTRGGTLALFTARSRMRQAFERLRPSLLHMGLTPLCQDVTGPRWALLEELRSDPRAVLLGLKSFWEGVDIPGDALRCVVICKLPFAVPDDPIIAARQEDVRARGGDPMNDYYLPEAVVGFKQGFGRLIRARTDRGVVFVLDRRLVTKGYGRRFFRSIDRCGLSRESLEECLSMAEEWLETVRPQE